MAVTDEAINKIKTMLVTGELKPGDRLPPEKELGERLGVSRSSLREAVKALEMVRVLDVRRGDGTYVTTLDPVSLSGAVSFVFDFLQDERFLLEIFEVRRILEPAATEIAAAKITPDQLAQLWELTADLDDSTSVEELVAKDLQFHRHIAQSAGNNYLVSLLDTLSSSTVRARIWRGITQEKAVAQTLAEHTAIIHALERADPDLSRSLAVVHISGVEDWLRKVL